MLPVTGRVVQVAAGEAKHPPHAGLEIRPNVPKDSKETG